MFDPVIVKNRSKWIKIAQTFGAGDDAEDFIQDTFIKLINHEYVNEALFYFALRNIVIDAKRKENIDRFVINYEYTFEMEKIYSFIDKFNPYDKKLYLLYIESKMSIREIAKETLIDYSSIFRTIKNCNKKLKKYIELELEPNG